MSHHVDVSRAARGPPQQIVIPDGARERSRVVPEAPHEIRHFIDKRHDDPAV